MAPTSRALAGLKQTLQPMERIMGAIITAASPTQPRDVVLLKLKPVRDLWLSRFRTAVAQSPELRRQFDAFCKRRQSCI